MAGNKITGSFAKLDSGAYYKIENAQDMPAFFINVATSSDIWMFLSSNGALTAGRQNAEGTLFPYETDDRLHLAAYTGPKTIVRLEDGRVWEPFNTGRDNPFTVKRSLYKRVTGDAILFEEINESLNLAFSYRWETGEKYGIVRTAGIHNTGNSAVKLEMLDGVENIMPYGVTQNMSESSSCLADSYKACERTGNLAVYSLTSMIVDSPEPVEILRANAAWFIGKKQAVLLSSRQMDAFAKGGAMEDEFNSTGRKGAFLVYKTLDLPAGGREDWILVMDARLSQKQMAGLLHEVNHTPENELRGRVQEDIANGTAELTRMVAAADGLQHTADKRADVRHYMNVLYNNMRGGVFLDGYGCDRGLFAAFLASRNKNLAASKADFLKDLSGGSILSLHESAYANGDPDLIRLALEFLPLTFSRRHGDPSRPWNRFNIRVKDDDGSRLCHYEGNWRDIFQNWEAMTLSFPGYIAPIIAKFLNASTIDGFNPYHISENGINWEVPQPHNPFSGYGYWGDHQIVYLNKLLEWAEAYAAEGLDTLIREEIFTYADVPYEIKPYASLLKDAKNTLAFNWEKHERNMKRVEQYGADGKLLMDDAGVYHASFMEKLLVPVLAKLSNLVLNGGIWMNTQRPEWNDANNAIVGNGLSMVTVYQLYRHLHCLQRLLKRVGGAEISLSSEVADWIGEIHQVMSEDLSPRAFLDKAGAAFEKYRCRVYAHGFSGKRGYGLEDLQNFTDTAMQILAKTIENNKREDGMYNGYNILKLTEDGLTVSPMFLMLEGQSAVLGSGRLSPDDAVSLAESMENSGLLSPEHKTFYLYPVKKLKTFMERNIIPAESVSKSALLKKLLSNGHEGFVLRDADGNVRFHDRIQQSRDLENGINSLLNNDAYKALAESEADFIWEIYELVFAHRQFTGRSGIMYKYEGIGSIYWHQNAKFLLSFQEAFTDAAGKGYERLSKVKETYYRLRAGFGFNKEPSLWGAFPLEPHSHTPSGMPAQQPGMTGQVKEDILTRFAELGIRAKDGVLYFEPALLRKEEFLEQDEIFEYVDLDGKPCQMPLPSGTLAFTVCQTPVMYRLSNEENITVYMKDGKSNVLKGNALGAEYSQSLFARDGKVRYIEVAFGEDKMV